MDTYIVCSREEFYKLEGDWKRIEQNNDQLSYYSTFDYCKTWWDVYGNNEAYNLFVICVIHNKNIIGIAPFIIENKTKILFTYRVLRFLGSGDYYNFIIDNDLENKDNVVKSIMTVIEENNKLFDRVFLINIPQNSYVSNYLLKSVQHNKHFTSSVECPRIYLNKICEWGKYKRQYIPEKTIKLINKLKKEIGYTFEIVNDNTDEVLSNISELHINEQRYLNEKSKIKDRYSIFVDDNQKKFIRKIYTNNSNIITFVIKSNNGEWMSYNTCYVYNRILYSWNSAYNPVYSKYSVAKIRIYEILNYLHSTKFVEVYDFGAGRYPWKFEWTKDFIYNYQLDIWTKSTIRGIVAFYFRNINKYFRLN